MCATGATFGFAALFVSEQFWKIKRSWRHEERCTKILFGSTLVMAVYAPDWAKDMELYEACVSSVLGVLCEGRRGGAKMFFNHWRFQRGTGDDVYRRKRHRGAQRDALTLVLEVVRLRSSRLQKNRVVQHHEFNCEGHLRGLTMTAQRCGFYAKKAWWWRTREIVAAGLFHWPKRDARRQVYLPWRKALGLVGSLLNLSEDSGRKICLLTHLQEAT